jgi:hypothetical protein
MPHWDIILCMMWRKYLPLNLPIDEIGGTPITFGVVNVTWELEIHRRYTVLNSPERTILAGSEMATALHEDFQATKLNEAFLPDVLHSKLPQSTPEALDEILDAGKHFAHYGPFTVAAFAPYLVSQLAALEWGPCVEDEAANIHVVSLQYHHMSWEIIYTLRRKRPIVLGLRYSLADLVS